MNITLFSTSLSVSLLAISRISDMNFEANDELSNDIESWWIRGRDDWRNDATSMAFSKRLYNLSDFFS